MKKLLFLLLFPFTANAQHLQINIISGPSLTVDPYGPHRYKEKLNVFADAQVCVLVQRWVFGAGVFTQNLTLRSRGHLFDAEGNTIDDAKIKIAEPAVVPYLTIGRSIKMAKLSIIPQVRAGYAFGGETQPDFATQMPGHAKSKGLALGGNIAVAYPLNRFISLRASAGVNYLMLKHEGYFTIKNNILTVPVGIGIGVGL